MFILKPRTCFYLRLFICLIALQVVPFFAEGQIQCLNLLGAADDSAILDNAYQVFLNRPKPRRTFDALPENLEFRGAQYHVVAFLGEGVEGKVFKVENNRGQQSIIKIFKHPHMIFSVEAFRYIYTSLKTGVIYLPIAIDSKTNSLKFRNVRGIPLDQIVEILVQIEAPADLIERVSRLVKRQRLGYNPDNQIFEIDKFKIVVIDSF